MGTVAVLSLRGSLSPCCHAELSLEVAVAFDVAFEVELAAMSSVPDDVDDRAT